MINYYDQVALSNTALGYLKKSPFHCQAFLQGRIKKDTQSMKLGRHLHAALLTPDLQTFFAANRNTKAGKELAAEQEAKGFTVVTEKEYELITNCIEVLKQDTEITKLLAGAECEKPLSTIIEGVKIKGLIDIFNPNFEGKSILADLKFLQDASPKDVYRKATYTYDYDRQLAWYYNLLTLCGYKVDEVWLIACEKEAPYAYSISKFHINSEFMQSGKAKWQELFELYKQTIHVGNAPSYGTVTYEEKQEAVNLLGQGQAIDFATMNFDDMIGLLTPQTVEPKPTVMADTKPPQIIEGKKDIWVTYPKPPPSEYEKLENECRNYHGKKGVIKRHIVTKQLVVEIIDHFGIVEVQFMPKTLAAARTLLKKHLRK
jgi:hypothetical protein